jgi:hypothetical protein
MAGLSTYAANALLNAMFNNTAFQVAQAYIQLHTADPGASGTTAVAGNATRKSVSFSAAASGAITNDADIDWTSGEVDTSEDYTHYSLWDASTVGNFLHSGTITANPVVSADTFKIAAGDLDITVTVAT